MTRLTWWPHRLHLLGSSRLRLALLFAALAATTVTLLTALPAQAEPAPPPSPSAPAPSTGAPEEGVPGAYAPTPEEQETIEDILARQSERLSKQEQQERLEEKQEELRKTLPDEGGVLSVFNVTDANNLPISLYTVETTSGGPLAWMQGLISLLTQLLFTFTKWLIAFCCWLIAWSLSFGLAKLLLSPVLAIANSLHARVIMEMGLPSLFLAVCALVCTARIFFGDRARGWADAAVSLVIGALTATLLASAPQALLGEDDGAIAWVRGLSLEVADIILDADPALPRGTDKVTTEATSFSLSRPLTDALTDSFIVKPAMLLQYDTVFEGECATAYAQTRLAQLAYERQKDAFSEEVSEVSHLADQVTPDNTLSSAMDWQAQSALTMIRNFMGSAPMEDFEKQCVPGDVTASKAASLDKLAGALFLLIATLIVTVLITGLAGSFLTAQARIAWDAIRAEPALVAGTVPGIGRAILWDWAASVLRSLTQMAWSVAFLAVFILILKAVLDPAQNAWGDELTLRFLVVDIVCIAAVKKRRQLGSRSHQIADNVRSKMASSRIGGTHGSSYTSSSGPSQRPRIARAAARGVVRSALVTTALVQRNPLAALGYAMPQTVGGAALLSRINTRGHGGRRPPRQRTARPAGRPAPHTPPNIPASGPHSTPPPPGHPPRPSTPPRSGPPPRPRHRPGSRPARSAGRPRRGSPGTGVPVNPDNTSPPQPASSSQQRLRQRLNRRQRRRGGGGQGGSNGTTGNGGAS